MTAILSMIKEQKQRQIRGSLTTSGSSEEDHMQEDNV